MKISNWNTWSKLIFFSIFLAWCFFWIKEWDQVTLRQTISDSFWNVLETKIFYEKVWEWKFNKELLLWKKIWDKIVFKEYYCTWKIKEFDLSIFSWLELDFLPWKVYNFYWDLGKIIENKDWKIKVDFTPSCEKQIIIEIIGKD